MWLFYFIDLILNDTMKEFLAHFLSIGYRYVLHIFPDFSIYWVRTFEVNYFCFVRFLNIIGCKIYRK